VTTIISLLDNGTAKNGSCINCPFFPCAWRLSAGVLGQAEGLNYVHQNRGIINEFENFPEPVTAVDRSCVTLDRFHLV
jgi:hypothetical protein